MFCVEIRSKKEGWENSGVGSLISCLNGLNMTSIYKYTCAPSFVLSSFMVPIHLWPLDQDLILINGPNWTITISNEMSPWNDASPSQMSPWKVISLSENIHFL